MSASIRHPAVTVVSFTRLHSMARFSLLRLPAPATTGLVVLVVFVMGAPEAWAGPPQVSSALQPLTPRGSLKKCLSGLWDGLDETFSTAAWVLQQCVKEQVQEVQFLLEDAGKLASKVGAELKEAAKNCTGATQRQGGPLDCLASLGSVLGHELKPVALMFGHALHLYLRLGFYPLLELLGCIFLPAILPILWNTFLDFIIFGECLLQK